MAIRQVEGCARQNVKVIESDKRKIMSSGTPPRTNAVRPGQFTIPLMTRIRECIKDDLLALEWFGMFTEHRQVIRSAFDAQMRGDNLMLIAEANRFPVGQIWIDVAKKRQDSIGLLWALRVFPAMQNLGIGTHLIAAAEELLRECELTFAELGVNKENTNACRLYERLGYKFVGQEYEQNSYTTPDGVLICIPADNWVRRKDLRR